MYSKNVPCVYEMAITPMKLTSTVVICTRLGISGTYAEDVLRCVLVEDQGRGHESWE